MVKEINKGISHHVLLTSIEPGEFNYDSPDIKVWIENLKDTFATLPKDAAGLAINQIYDDNLHSMPPMFIARTPKSIDGEIFLNPRGLGTGGHVSNYEGCSSFPSNTPIKKSRHKNYTILYLNEKGEEQSFKVGPPWSLIIQHEVDHLEGKVLYGSHNYTGTLCRKSRSKITEPKNQQPPLGFPPPLLKEEPNTP